MQRKLMSGVFASTSPWQFSGFRYSRISNYGRSARASEALGELRWAAAREIRPDFSPAIAASSANEPRLDIRQANIVRPAIGVEGNMMAAMAVDQDPAHAHLAHLTEHDLHRPTVGVRRRVAACRAKHTAIKAASYVPRKLSIPWAG